MAALESFAEGCSCDIEKPLRPVFTTRSLIILFISFQLLLIISNSKTMSEILIEPDVAAVVQRLALIVEKCANEAIDNEDIFKIGLSGEFLICLFIVVYYFM